MRVGEALAEKVQRRVEEARQLASGIRCNPGHPECSRRVIESGDLVAFDTDPGGSLGLYAKTPRNDDDAPSRGTGNVAGGSGSAPDRQNQGEEHPALSESAYCWIPSSSTSNVRSLFGGIGPTARSP
ncbi:hypothetical protein EHZ25_17275 [Paraburkholderia tropica]|nr:hypothetical protein EHZ25_17275 [Paraburkholderia tropica]